jgi:hypothetical protein
MLKDKTKKHELKKKNKMNRSKYSKSRLISQIHNLLNSRSRFHKEV